MFENLSLPIIISISVLALIDSINPVELLAGIFLFTAKKPIKCFIPYTLGIFFFHLMLGFIFYYAFHFVLELKIFDSPIFDRSIELIGGILLIVFAVIMKKKNSEKIEFDPKPLYTFLLGIGITTSAIPTSASYFSALGIVANNDLKFAGLGFLLLLYNIIFVLPLFILLAIYLIFKERSERIFKKIRSFIANKLNASLRIIFALIGMFLIADFVLYLLGRPMI